jgi:hypothetical protein
MQPKCSCANVVSPSGIRVASRRPRVYYSSDVQKKCLGSVGPYLPMICLKGQLKQYILPLGFFIKALSLMSVSYLKPCRILIRIRRDGGEGGQQTYPPHPCPGVNTLCFKVRVCPVCSGKALRRPKKCPGRFTWPSPIEPGNC